jgi:hypothetical protein
MELSPAGLQSALVSNSSNSFQVPRLAGLLTNDGKISGLQELQLQIIRNKVI